MGCAKGQQESGPLSASPPDIVVFVSCQCQLQASRQLDRAQNPQSPCPSNGPRPAVDAEFAVDITGVDLDRIQRQKKPGSDFWVGKPFGEKLEYFKFAFAQRFDQLMFGSFHF